MNARSIVLGGGCFWCLEATLESLKGVYSVENGYAGGKSTDVTYEQVCSGQTGHAEVVKVFFDPKEISEDDLLHMFFAIHDPTTLNRQGPDFGTQYRSVIFYASEEERELANMVKNEVDKEGVYDAPIVTSIEPLKNYVKAEDYHQNYFEKYEKASEAQKMTMNAGYCSAVIQPKVQKFRAKYAAKLKKKD